MTSPTPEDRPASSQSTPQQQARRPVRRGSGTPRLSRLIAEAEGYLEDADRRYGQRPQLARATVLAREVREVGDQLTRMHHRIRRLENALRLERRARKYAVQLLDARTPGAML